MSDKWEGTGWGWRHVQCLENYKVTEFNQVDKGAAAAAAACLCGVLQRAQQGRSPSCPRGRGAQRQGANSCSAKTLGQTRSLNSLCFCVTFCAMEITTIKLPLLPNHCDDLTHF